MKDIRHGLGIAVREHIAAGLPITRLEALVLFGVQNLPDVIRHMRRDGWVIQAKPVPYAAAMKRVNEHAELQPPKNLPIREVQLTEYWVS